MRPGDMIFESVKAIEEKFNHYPSKRLGHRTPEQMFELSFNRVALHG
jgi:IS30 family transposase